MNKGKLVVQHVENAKYENDLKEALGYGEAVYFYKIAEVLEELGLNSDEFSPMYGDVAFLVSNQSLTNEQLRAEVEPYIPEREEEDTCPQRVGHRAISD
jgi:hypothetical protein